MEHSIVYDVPHLLSWDWRIAVDLFLGGIGVGAFLFAVLVSWRHGEKHKRVCRTAAWTAPVFVGLGLVFLMTELGHPFRLVRTFLVVAPSSPLWWGGIFQTLFMIGSVVYALLWRRNTRPQLRLWFGVGLLPIAVVVGAYHGFLMALIPARPLWNTGPTMVAAILAFVTTGIAAVMLIHLIRAKLSGRLADAGLAAEFFRDMRAVRNVLGGALVLQVLTLFVWWVSLRAGPASAQTALDAANSAHGPLFWWIAIGLGLVAPLGLGAFTIAATSRREVSEEILNTPVAAHLALETHMIWITSGLILLGGFVMRLAVVLGGQAA